MPGGKGKIHEHPKHNTNGLRENPENINKSGRPLGVRNSATVIRRLLELSTKKVNELTGEEETYFDEIAFAQLKKAIDGDTQAFNALLDRMEGKATQRTENDTNINIPDIDTWAAKFRKKG